MKERTFNSLMPLHNERWSAQALNMQINPNRGPDLIDDEKAIEIKFKMIYSNGKYSHKCWRVLGHQIDYNKEFTEIYWGLGFYQINKDVKKTKANELEKITEYRELYIVDWEWMKQFPIYHHQGKTKYSDWDYYMLFPKFSLIPRIIQQQNTEGGKIFFTEGVDPERFNINRNSSHQNTYKDVPF
jgi:hypothetical protein